MTTATRAQLRLRGLVVVGLVSGVVAALSTLVVLSLLTPPPLRVATVDVSGLVLGEIERLQQNGMDASKAEAYAHLWGPLLDKSVQAIANDYGVVLLASPAVAAGAPDLTNELRERLDRDLEAFQ
ncbi:MAG: TrbI F-type domain-containing protein [Woeseiaceae bacterium]|nr:TrbI F-type domain-containing protein [Woeseiaceae bacterium]